jgi:L-galactonate dehydratase
MAFTGQQMKDTLQKTLDEGYTVFKFKVGTDRQQDRERLLAVREVLGYDKGYQIMIDANQVNFELITALF